MTPYTSTHLAIGLVADATDNPENPTFSKSHQELIAFIGVRATATGWHGNDEAEGWFVIDVKDPTLVEDLYKQSFVDQFPVPGDHPEVVQAKDLTVQEPSFAPGLTT